MSKRPTEAAPEPMTRKSVALPDSLWEAINDFRFAHRLTTETAAMRRIVELGLQAAQELEPSPKPARKPRGSGR